MSRSRWSVRLFLGACAALAPAGCTQILGIEDLPPLEAPVDGRPPSPSPVDAAVTGDAAVDAGVDAPPGPRPLPEDVVHVPEAGWLGDTSDRTWTGNVTIDTTSLTISGSGTEGQSLRAQAHDPAGGPELALLHVGTLTVNEGVNVRVTGSRPLVIISSESIVLDGRIDAGADFQAAGAGGAGPGAGAGAGQNGSHTAGTPNDGGGGGGGHGTNGARGGLGCPEGGGIGTTCDNAGAAAGGAAGGAYGDQSVSTLFGGSGGGRGGEGDGSCAGGPGGAGGGAVQLYALDTITIGGNGGISVGGGGGQGGGQVGACAGSGGGGGGSGGSVYLQAERLRIDGLIAANGGGGGSGASGLDEGSDGANGTLATTQAGGGTDVGEGSSSGGAGAADTNAPRQGTDGDGESNAGGGGGSAGRIALHCTDVAGNGGRFSPPGILLNGCRQI